MIQHIRLINGDEIIGDVISVSEKTITIDNPLHVEERVNDMGYAGIVLTKYIPFSQYKVCELQKQHVITTTELDPAVQKYYYLSLKINKNMIIFGDSDLESFVWERRDKKNTQFIVGIIDSIISFGRFSITCRL